MIVTHLEAPQGTLCWTRALHPALTTDGEMVTCLRCQRRMARLAFEQAEAESEKRLDDRNRAAAEAVGMIHVLDFLAADDSPTSSMLYGIVGTVAVYMHETGLVMPRRSA